MTRKKYIATRGVSWRDGEDGWVNREEGDEISDAPEDALEELLKYPKGDPAAVGGAEWAERQRALKEAARDAEPDEPEANTDASEKEGR